MPRADEVMEWKAFVAVYESALVKVSRRRPRQTFPHRRRRASGNLQGTKPRERARIRRCLLGCYGDLAVGGPQLRSAARVGRAVRMAMQVGGDALL
jgi:hypothetical protein